MRNKHVVWSDRSIHGKKKKEKGREPFLHPFPVKALIHHATSRSRSGSSNNILRLLRRQQRRLYVTRKSSPFSHFYLKRIRETRCPAAGLEFSLKKNRHSSFFFCFHGFFFVVVMDSNEKITKANTSGTDTFHMTTAIIINISGKLNSWDFLTQGKVKKNKRR